MDKIIQTWGAKSYPEPRIQQIWELVRNLAYYELNEVVGDLIASEKFAPMPVDIMTRISKIRSRKEKERVDRFLSNKIGETCTWCDKTGMVVAQHRGKLTTFVFRCVCDFGEFFDYKYEPWRASYLEEYEPDYEKFRKKALPASEDQPKLI